MAKAMKQKSVADSLIPISRKFYIANAAKTENLQSSAPHPYQQKILHRNCRKSEKPTKLCPSSLSAEKFTSQLPPKAKSPQSSAPHPYQQKILHRNCRQKPKSPKLCPSSLSAEKFKLQMPPKSKTSQSSATHLIPSQICKRYAPMRVPSGVTAGSSVAAMVFPSAETAMFWTGPFVCLDKISFPVCMSSTCAPWTL